MSLTDQIQQALNKPFDAAAQGLDSSEYFGLGVWHDGPTLDESWIKISRELNTETGKFENNIWIPEIDPTAQTDIDILDKRGTGKGNVKDINELKAKFDDIRRFLPPGDYHMNADDPRKARLYQREWLKQPGFRLSGEEAQGRYTNKKGEIIKEKFQTMVMTVPEGPPDLSDYTWNGGHAAKKARSIGLTEFMHDGEHVTLYEGKFKKPGQIEARRASQRRGGSREASQKLKEEVYQQTKDKYTPLTSAEQERVQIIKDNARSKGMDADHQYGKAAYDEGKINHPEVRKPLDKNINRFVKPHQEKQLSQYMLSQELYNPSKSMDLSETLDLASNKKKWYGDVIHNFAENRALFGNIDVSKISSADSALQVGAGLATGDIGAVIGGSAGFTLQNPAVQKLLMKRFAKSGAKLAPGVGITLSALEAKGYASQGRWTQAGVAALSGAVGEVPVVGDAASAVLDFGNTVTDILTGNFGSVTPEEDPNIRRNIDGINFKRPRL